MLGVWTPTRVLTLHVMSLNWSWKLSRPPPHCRARRPPASTIGGPTTMIKECGETPEEARSRSCRFDAMLQLWVPASCYDEEHSEFYLSTYQWKWYCSRISTCTAAIWCSSGRPWTHGKRRKGWRRMLGSEGVRHIMYGRPGKRQSEVLFVCVRYEEGSEAARLCFH